MHIPSERKGNYILKVVMAVKCYIQFTQHVITIYMICQLTRGRFLSNCVIKNLNTLLYSAYFHLFLMNNDFIISNDLENPIAEVLHDINRNGKQIFIKSNMAVGRHLGFIAYRDLRSKLKCHHCTRHGPKPHVRHIAWPSKFVSIAFTHMPKFPPKLGLSAPI